MSLKKVVECVKRKNNFLITTHVNPEGDALGSELAFWRLVRSLGKRATVVNDDVLPYGYEFLPYVNKISRFKNKTRDAKFDCLAVVDCSDLGRCGQVGTVPLEGKTILNIDHHISNSEFGSVNWVRPEASSCAEMVFELYKKMRMPLDKKTATLLYAGILTDTGSFRYSNTDGFTHQVAAELIGYGLDVAKIYRNMSENIPLADIKLLLAILPEMETSANGKIVWFKIRRRLYKNRKISFDLSEQLLNFARSIKDMEVAVLFKENLRSEDEVRVNFRSRGKIDVNKIAGFFGGGGHKAASGCTIKGNIDRVSRMVLEKVNEKLK